MTTKPQRPASCLPHEREAGRRLIVALDDDVLEQIAEAGLDRALVTAVDLEIVGDGTLLPDVAVGVHEDHAGGVAELRAAGRRAPRARRGGLRRPPAPVPSCGSHGRAARARRAPPSVPLRVRPSAN